METTLDDRMQQLAARVLARMPPPPTTARLASLRARVAEELLERYEGEIAVARERFLERRARPDAPSWPHPGCAASELSALAERLVRELRRAVVARARSLDGVLARLDARLPTERAEYIDDPLFSEARRTAALRSLDALNRRLGSYVRFLDALEPLLDAGSVTLVDLASGHGGFPLALAPLARARGHALRIVATDLRDEYLAIGRRRAAARGECDVEFRRVDAFHLDRAFAPGAIDLVTCTQSLHHFGAGGVAALAAEALAQARVGLLFVDGARSLSHAAAIGALNWLGTFDRYFTHDGVRSE